MRAAIYARYSSDNQREESIDAQIRAIKEYAQRNNMEITKIYTDEARSATTDNRPKFLQMVKDSSLKIFDTIIVHKLDRFSRDRYDSAFYKKQLKKNGIKLISVLENIDDTPESIILESVLEGMAEYYSKNLAREVMKGMKENALKCKSNGGTPPLGYDVVDGRYVINEYEAAIVKYIFDSYTSGMGYKKIISDLKSKGYKTKKGNDFTQSSLHDILKNEKYIGTYVFNRQSEKINGKRNQHMSKPEDQIIKIENGIPAIISKSLFQSLKEKMNNRANGRYKAKVNYLLSGKIYCGKCGSAMIGHTSHNKGFTYTSYVCGTRYRTKNCDLKAVKKEYIEDNVMQHIQDNILNKDSIKELTVKLIHHYNKIRNEDTEDLKIFEKRLNEIDNKIENIVNAIADGLYSPSMKTAMSDLEEQKSQITNMINEIKIKFESKQLNMGMIESYLLRDVERLKNKNVDDLKEIINTYVDKVIVTDDKIDTNLKVVHMNGAGNGNRTRIAGLGSRNSTIELYLHLHYLLYTFLIIFQLHLQLVFHLQLQLVI